MPTDELSTRLAAIYAQCLTAAATYCVADRTQPDGDRPLSAYGLGQLADDWFQRAIREGAIAAINFEDTFRSAARDNNLRKQYAATASEEE